MFALELRQDATPLRAASLKPLVTAHGLHDDLQKAADRIVWSVRREDEPYGPDCCEAALHDAVSMCSFALHELRRAVRCEVEKAAVRARSKRGLRARAQARVPKEKRGKV